VQRDERPFGEGPMSGLRRPAAEPRRCERHHVTPDSTSDPSNTCTGTFESGSPSS
jgi:hypothetical protein